jgi:hypothetical protein
MTSVDEMLKRQAQWQKSRQHLTWPEKIRMAEQVRDSVVALRRASPGDRRDETAASPRQALGHRPARR